jgi:hypothetical protein
MGVGREQIKVDGVQVRKASDNMQGFNVALVHALA